MRDAVLRDCPLNGADLEGAIFEPKSLPEIRGIAAAVNLQFVTYDKNPDKLVELRQAFKVEGFREQERGVTYALKRREAEIAWQSCSWRRPWHTCGTYLFNRIFFDLTSKYGMIPGRPPLLILALCVVFMALYRILLFLPSPSGLYLVAKRRLARGEMTQGMGNPVEGERDSGLKPNTIPL